MRTVRVIDLFCGVGGSAWGARNAGAEIVAGFDKWELAGKSYLDNFPEARFFSANLDDIEPESLTNSLSPIDLIIASPECTNHSPAKGNKPRCEKSKETGFHVIRFAEVFNPRWLVIENVVNMRSWTRYSEFIGMLHRLGYNTTEQVLNSKDFGVPQSRRRLFILCDKENKPPIVKPGKRKPMNARRIINPNGKYAFSPLRTERRAVATIERAERAMTELGKSEPFLIVYYGSDQAGGWQGLDRPLRTITTLDRFAYVKPTIDGHVMRMLQPDELKAAMSMPGKFQVSHGTRRNRIKMIGNAVCPKVMEAVVRQLITMSPTIPK